MRKTILMKRAALLILPVVASVACGGVGEPQEGSSLEILDCLVGPEACDLVPGTPLQQWENIGVEVHIQHNNGDTESQSNIAIHLEARDADYCPWPPEASATIDDIEADLVFKHRPSAACGTVMVWELPSDRWPENPREESQIVITDGETELTATVPGLLDSRGWMGAQQSVSPGDALTLAQNHNDLFQLPAAGGIELVPEAGDAREGCVSRNGICTVMLLQDFTYSEGLLVVQIPTTAPVGAARLEFNSRLKMPATCSHGCNIQLQVDSSVAVEITD